jgi:hypothetical protein
MASAQVVIDLANSPSFEDKAVLEFIETSGRNLLAAEAATGVWLHVALSIVGTDRHLGAARAMKSSQRGERPSQSASPITNANATLRRLMSP